MVRSELLYTSLELAAGEHTLIKVTGDKNSSSFDYYVTADKVEIID